jgi:uncharacterized protein (TIGR00730 family)
MRVCIFASSSSRISSSYADAATELGVLLAKAGTEVVFGGGGIGLMGKIADTIIKNNGIITGVIPSFMKDQGWDHTNVNEMIVTSDMAERKKQMFSMADAIIALPGGVGTLEELTEAITLKQLGLFRGPIIILNTLNFYNSLLEFFDHMVSESFLRYEHKSIWEVAATPLDVMMLLGRSEPWLYDPIKIAKI